MNRRHFLSVSAVAATLSTVSGAPAGGGGRIKVLIPTTPPERLSELAEAAPEVELVQCRDEAEALANVAGAHAAYGFISAKLIRAGKDLRWVQQGSAGVEQLMEISELVEGDIVLTNMQRIYAPEIADQALGYLLSFTRSLGRFILGKSAETWRQPGPEAGLAELDGKTLVVTGLGGTGTHTPPPPPPSRIPCPAP